MLNTRLPVSLNEPTCRITDTVSTTNSPPRTTSSSSVRVTMAIAANAPPSASEPVSPMKILRRAGVPPQEAEAGAHRRGRDDRDVERISRDVAGRGRCPRRRSVAELPERDDHVGAEDHRAGAGGQPVEPVGEVHRVGGRRDHQPGQHREADRADREGRCRGRRRARWSPAGSPWALRKRTASSPNASATASWPTNLVRADSPRLRCLRILM